MKKAELVERAKMYLELLVKGIHPVTGEQIPADSALWVIELKTASDLSAEFLMNILNYPTKLKNSKI